MYIPRPPHSSSPPPGLPPPGVIAIAAGDNHTCVVLSGGSVDCWGSNSNGQLGTGDTNDRLTPTPVMGLVTGGENSQYVYVLIRLDYFWGVKSLYTAPTPQLALSTTLSRVSDHGAPVAVPGPRSTPSRCGAQALAERDGQAASVQLTRSTGPAIPSMTPLSRAEEPVDPSRATSRAAW